jgi:hypothetical protein
MKQQINFAAGVLQPPLVVLKHRKEKEIFRVWAQRKKKLKKNPWKK